MRGLQEAWLDHVNAVYRDEPPRFTNGVWRMSGQAERDGELVTLWYRPRVIAIQRKAAQPVATAKAA